MTTRSRKTPMSPAASVAGATVAITSVDVSTEATGVVQTTTVPLTIGPVAVTTTKATDVLLSTTASDDAINELHATITNQTNKNNLVTTTRTSNSLSDNNNKDNNNEKIYQQSTSNNTDSPIQTNNSTLPLDDNSTNANNESSTVSYNNDMHIIIILMILCAY